MQKHLTPLLFSILLFGLQACNDNDCDEIVNRIGRQQVLFSIGIEKDGENLFHNEAYIPDSIKIVNLLNNEEINFSIYEESNINDNPTKNDHRIYLEDIGAEKNLHYSFIHKGEKLFTFKMSGNEVIENCTQFISYHKRELNKESGLIDEKGLVVYL
ncbi:MAG: hypothetical protein ACI85I_001253 [Arenicella sp.]|jgi:hypothetical protein